MQLERVSYYQSGFVFMFIFTGCYLLQHFNIFYINFYKFVRNLPLTSRFELTVELLSRVLVML